MIRTILVDDEENAINALKILLKENCSDIEVVGEAHSALQGIKEINSQKPDLVFLDVDMPHGSGFELLEGLPERNFHVIFVTAHSSYAVKAFKFNAVDYLVKPVNQKELTEAVKKVKNSIQTSGDKINHEVLMKYLKQTQLGKIGIPTGDGVEFMEPNDIIHVDADGSYTRIITKHNTIMVSKYLKEIQLILDEECFFRPHNSYIINLNHVKKYNSKECLIIMTDGSSIVLAKNKKPEFLNLMSRIK
jgi:two-component system, LytTR family, response regulator